MKAMALIVHINPPEDGLIYTANNTKLKIGDKIVGKGTLYISQNYFGWQAENMSEGISIPWKQISVHGISSIPSKCIYFMLDHNLEWRGVYDKETRASAPNISRNGNVNGAEVAQQINGEIVHMEQQLDDERNIDVDEGNVTDDEGDNTDDHLTECWILPDDVNTVDIIFQAMTECQALHPDSADSLSEESDFMDDDDGNSIESVPVLVGNDEIDDAEDAQGGIRNLNLNDERFADADE
ncbi:methylosome subunit pICln [Zeugodacus cucurbitae]|uniref:Methylosome subunit pICln n=1 Tax=Zeugodacus cucurbitae TaxID=28588 RepID=A0A0A1X9C3_ZEUCU|nr:methylosome subunit pICln [Zeugodacus cucurbitae]